MHKNARDHFDIWRPSRLTLVQREERRLAAARLFRAGNLTQVEIARRLGVSPGAVSQWYLAWRGGGEDELRARPRPGRRPRLTRTQWARLAQILERGPMAAGFDSMRWTLEGVAALIAETFGVDYHPRYLGRPLRRQGVNLGGPPARRRAGRRSAGRRTAELPGDKGAPGTGPAGARRRSAARKLN